MPSPQVLSTQSAVQASPGPFCRPSSQSSPGSCLPSPQTGSPPVVEVASVVPPVSVVPVLVGAPVLVGVTVYR